MARFSTYLAAVGIALTPAAPVFAQQPPADIKAKFEQDAKKSCSYDLDHDRFGNYGSLEECVSDRSMHSERDYAAKSGTNQARAGAQSNHPN